jgi:hypothetical protein
MQFVCLEACPGLPGRPFLMACATRFISKSITYIDIVLLPGDCIAGVMTVFQRFIFVVFGAAKHKYQT